LNIFVDFNVLEGSFQNATQLRLTCLWDN